MTAPPPGEAWAYPRYASGEGEERARPYRRRYALDVAGGTFATAPTGDYNAGGAAVAFSDLLGDDRIYVNAYSASPVGRSFLDGLNASVTRVHFGRRANFGYGLFRSAGAFYDRGDPDQIEAIPTYQQIHGGLGLVELPALVVPPRRHHLLAGVQREGAFRRPQRRGHRVRHAPHADALERPRARPRQRALQPVRARGRVARERRRRLLHGPAPVVAQLLHALGRRAALRPPHQRRHVRLVGAGAGERRPPRALQPPRRGVVRQRLPAAPHPRPADPLHLAGAPLPHREGAVPHLAAARRLRRGRASTAPSSWTPRTPGTATAPRRTSSTIPASRWARRSAPSARGRGSTCSAPSCSATTSATASRTGFQWSEREPFGEFFFGWDF